MDPLGDIDQKQADCQGKFCKLVGFPQAAQDECEEECLEDVQNQKPHASR